jgi:sodium-dependent dicarboxylate transporter 2/3/5
MILKKAGLPIGLILFFLVLTLPAPEGMSPEAKKTAAVAVLMGAWWITEAIPIAVTALLPVALFPLLGVTSSADAASSYANHLIFLFMGGFIIALAMQKWNLHRRIALRIIDMAGTSPLRIILGFMTATAFLSMWVSNTATTIMMVPIGMAVIGYFCGDHSEGTDSNFALSLMLGIAYSASVGGIGTLIGTPPNLVLANTMEEMYDITIGFSEWFAVGFPLVLIMIPLIWLWLTRVVYPPRAANRQSSVIGEEIRRLGPASRGEKIILTVFVLTALCWIFRQTKEIGGLVIPGLDRLMPNVSDSAIAVFFAALTFLIPVKRDRLEFLMDWEHASRLPWGILLLFGGGLSLANGFRVSGLARWIGASVRIFSNTPEIVLIGAVIAVIIFLTEMTSNTATTAMALPILGSVAVGLGKEPMVLLAPAAIAASCAYMLPVATPPNAIIFASGCVKIPQMSKAGFFLNLISIAVILLLTYFYIIPVMIR